MDLVALAVVVMGLYVACFVPAAMHAPTDAVARGFGVVIGLLAALVLAILGFVTCVFVTFRGDCGAAGCLPLAGAANELLTAVLLLGLVPSPASVAATVLLWRRRRRAAVSACLVATASTVAWAIVLAAAT